MNYFDYQEQSAWLDNYIEGYFGGYYLAFTEKFMKENLPANSTSENSLQVELVLRKDPTTVQLDSICSVYELKKSCVCNVDNDYRCSDAWTLQNYFYTEHYCPCHRVEGAIRHGYVPQEKDYDISCPRGLCGEIIFDVKKIYYKDQPEIILYSETLSLEELDILLKNTVK